MVWPRVRWVVLDVGETLVDETRQWAAWAVAVGTTPLVLAAALGASIAAGEHHHRALDRVRPGWAALPDAGDWLDEGALHGDARPALTALLGAGLRVAVAGNQPASAEAAVRALGLPVDAVASSATLGAEKPSPLFFERLLALLGADPREVVHVGDRRDNDVAAAQRAGLRAVWLRRGPWALLQPDSAAPGAVPDAVVDDLLGLVDLLI